MGTQQQNEVQFVKFSPLTLKVSYNDESNDFGVLTFATRNDYPRFIVYTKNKRPQGERFDYETMVTAAFDLINFNTFLGYMEQAIDLKNDEELSVDCYNTKYVNNERTNEVAIQATARVGKSSKGIIYLSITADGKRKVKFPLLPNDTYMKFKDVKGNVITDKAELSKMYTTSYVRVLKKLLYKSTGKFAAAVQPKRDKSTTTNGVDTSSLKEADLF